MSLELPVTETASETPNDYSNLPASAFPAGVDPATYVQSLNKAEPETPSKPERPAHIPEKFWDADKGEARWEDLAKSYAELEAKFSGKTEEPAKSDTLKIEKSDGDFTTEDTSNPITSAFEGFAKVYQDSNGQPGADDIQKIVDLGIPQETVDNYLAGLQALAREQFSNAYAAAGGEDQFNAAIDWAKTGLTPAEQDSYNTLVDNQTTARQGIEWLMAKFNAARPSEGTLIEADADNATGDVFRSNAEVTGMIRDPRYKTDPAFRQDVMDKLQRTRDAGISL
jgi:hypothetical protein